MVALDEVGRKEILVQSPLWWAGMLVSCILVSYPCVLLGLAISQDSDIAPMLPEMQASMLLVPLVLWHLQVRGSKGKLRILSWVLFGVTLGLTMAISLNLALAAGGFSKLHARAAYWRSNCCEQSVKQKPASTTLSP